MKKKIPEYCVSKDNMTYYLVFLFFFSMLFVNIFTPFKGAWYNQQTYTRLQLFTDTVVIVTGGIVVLMLSRLAMFYVHKRKGLTVFWYILWQVAEILVLAFLYALICNYAINDNREFGEILARAMLYVPLLYVLPTLISYLFFNMMDKNEKLKVFTEIGSEDFVGDEYILDNHITRPHKTDEGISSDKLSKVQGAIPANSDGETDTNRIFNFLDEKDELQISLKINNIYYIESAENYINIYYNNKDSVERFTMRSTLKKQFDRLEKHGFIRCHRSYVVNFGNIMLLIREKDGTYLDFGVKGLQRIPISKTYLESVTNYFIKNSGD